MEVRIDKYLFCIRAYKTRSIATQACQGDKVKVNNQSIKPAHIISVGDEIRIRKGPIEYIYKVIALTNNRVGPKLVQNYVQDMTPQENIDKYINNKQPHPTTRPTKRERRDLINFLEYADYD